MISPDLLPDEVVNSIGRRLGWDDNADFQRYYERIAQMSVTEALNKYLEWHGIIGFTEMIIEALDSLRAAEADARARFESQR